MAEHFDPSYLDAIPLPAIFVDQNARVAGANERAVSLQPQARKDLPFILVFRQPALNTAVETCLETRSRQRAVYFHNEGPQEHRFDVTCAPVQGTFGRGAVICFRDVTELRQLDQMRRDFVANVSHELRTPLTAILGFIETLQGPARNDPQAQERFLSTMATTFFASCHAAKSREVSTTLPLDFGSQEGGAGSPAHQRASIRPCARRQPK